MKIKYVHFSEPDKTKIHDTEIALRKNLFITKSQKEFDDFTLRLMERDKQKGHILSYEIINEEVNRND